MRRCEPYEFTTDRLWEDASELAKGAVSDDLTPPAEPPTSAEREQAHLQRPCAGLVGRGSQPTACVNPGRSIVVIHRQARSG